MIHVDYKLKLCRCNYNQINFDSPTRTANGNIISSGRQDNQQHIFLHTGNIESGHAHRDMSQGIGRYDIDHV